MKLYLDWLAKCDAKKEGRPGSNNQGDSDKGFASSMPKAGFYVLDTAEIICRGKDAQNFLQGLTTNDLGLLSKRGLIESMFLYSTGKLLCCAIIRKVPEGFSLLVDAEARDQMMKYLDYFHIIEDVAISMPKSEEESFCCLIYGSTDVNISKSLPPAVDCGDYSLLAVSGSTDDFDALKEAGYQPLSPQDILQARFFLNCPRPNLDYKASPYPHEVGFEKFVSFTKGCFVGQEPVSRMQNKARPTKKLVCLSSPNPLVQGDSVLVDGAVAGAVVSSSELPQNGRYFAFAQLRTKLFSDPVQQLQTTQSEKLKVHGHIQGS